MSKTIDDVIERLLIELMHARRTTNNMTAAMSPKFRKTPKEITDEVCNEYWELSHDILKRASSKFVRDCEGL